MQDNPNIDDFIQRCLLFSEKSTEAMACITTYHDQVWFEKYDHI